MSRQIIGFCGRMGAGKSTASRHLVRVHDFQPIRFAGPLKDMLLALGLTRRQVDGPDKEAPSDLLCGRTPRHAMQTLGLEWGRNLIAPDLWERLWAHRVRACSGNVVADDVRFANEIDAIHALGGVVIKVERSGLAPSAHPSETVPLEADYTVRNDASPDDLADQIDWILYRLKATPEPETAPADIAG
jgi:hypothetical protein